MVHQTLEWPFTCTIISIYMALSCMKCMIEFNRVTYTVIMCMEGSLHCHVHLESTLCDACMVCHTSPQVHGVTACMWGASVGSTMYVCYMIHVDSYKEVGKVMVSEKSHFLFLHSTTHACISLFLVPHHPQSTRILPQLYTSLEWVGDW